MVVKNKQEGIIRDTFTKIYTNSLTSEFNPLEIKIEKHCEVKGLDSGSSSNSVKEKLYNPPDCSQFGVLHKPDVNKWILRGCQYDELKKNHEKLNGKNCKDICPEEINCNIGGIIGCEDNPNYDKSLCQTACPDEEHTCLQLCNKFDENYDRQGCEDHCNAICDFGGGLCESPRILGGTLQSKNEFLENVCNNNAIGGLANPEFNMDKHDSNSKNSDYYRNGFIMDACECQFHADDVKQPSDDATLSCKDKYDCFGASDDIGNGVVKYIHQMKKGEDDESSVFERAISDLKDEVGIDYDVDTSNDYNRISSDIWTGKRPSDGSLLGKSCNNAYKTYKPADGSDNACSNYIQKWAETCRWCKDTKAITPPDLYAECTSDSMCSSNFCFVFGGDTGICMGEKELDCTICDSKLWDNIPGGWEAVVDESHRLHDIAKMAYIPKKQSVDTNTNKGGKCDDVNTPSCGQPSVIEKESIPYVFERITDIKWNGNERGENTGWVGGVGGTDSTLDGEVFHTGCSADETSFVNAGMWINYNTLGFVVPIPIPGPKPIWTTYIKTFDSSGYWPNNNASNVCNTCSKSVECNNTEDSDDPTQWSSDTKGNSELINKLFNTEDNMYDCEVRDEYYYYINGSSDNSTFDSAKLMCERNPLLTGYGLTNNPVEDKVTDELNEDVDTYCQGQSTASSYTTAKNWIQGKIDLSEFGGDEDYKPYTNSEINTHIIEATRCCLGLTPGWIVGKDEKGEYISNGSSLKREDCMPATTCPNNKLCKDLFKDTLTGDLPHRDASEEDKKDIKQMESAYFGTDFPENYNPNGNEDGTTSQQMQNLAYYAKMRCGLLTDGSDDPDFFDDTETTTLCRKYMYNYGIEPVDVQNFDEKSNTNPENSYRLNSYKLPLRVFTDSVYDWCKNKDTDFLPDNKGVCDMLLGSACQQLQVDGWIKPENDFQNSPLLYTFAKPQLDSDGEVIIDNNLPQYTWTELDSNISHSIDSDRLKNTCSCFLLGSECGANNCSYFYCGAGLDGERGPRKVSLDDWNDSDWAEEDIDENNDLNKDVTIGNYDVGKWEANINKDFTMP